MNFGKQFLVSFVLVYLISLSFACETSFLGFELDLLTHEFLVNFVCWISTLRNPWYSFSSSIYFSIRASCSFISGRSNPETPDIAPDTPDHQTRSIRDSLCLTTFVKCFKLQIAYSPPFRHLKILSSPGRLSRALAGGSSFPRAGRGLLSRPTEEQRRGGGASIRRRAELLRRRGAAPAEGEAARAACPAR